MHFIFSNILYLSITFLAFIEENNFSEEYALLTIFVETGGNSWRMKESWLEGDNICDWYGVLCNGNDEVIELNLANNNMRGGVTSSMSKSRL